ncbi:hypothetical protein GOV05_04205 [Candidatus Woesearchaeota archaeon]|nr:hypothetical protein [Candidatus Woesearchaeota archaeon]
MIYQKVISVLSNVFNKVLVALFILFFGFLIAKIIEKFVYFILKELRLNTFIKWGLGYRIDAEKLISRNLYLVLFLLTIFLSLNSLGIAWYVLVVWIFFVLIVFAVSVLLDLKDSLLNFYHGTRINKKRLRPGVVVEAKNIKGKVVKKTLFGISILYREIHYVPYIFLKEGYKIIK